MKTFLKLIASCAVIFCSASECTKNDESPESRVDLIVCTPNDHKIKDVKDQKGTIYLNKELNKYCIYIGVNGTYDTQIVAVLRWFQKAAHILAQADVQWKTELG